MRLYLQDRVKLKTMTQQSYIHTEGSKISRNVSWRQCFWGYMIQLLLRVKEFIDLMDAYIQAIIGLVGTLLMDRLIHQPTVGQPNIFADMTVSAVSGQLGQQVSRPYTQVRLK